ncbi:MAG TPA: L-2-hydroxyglutarate oxidase [Gemmatimonadaceae bacterium]|nr:L-2-hydroxyglutarate oxidase [Gemmatimonadaceae bacterium]
MPHETTDFLVVGGGIIGLSIALEVSRRFPRDRITLIEKESETGLHASGRNSGVLHAGFYYTADSLKARFTRDGNRALTTYCEQRRLRINHCGKLVVARNESELEGLAELSRRAKVNSVELHEITATEAKKIEPRVKTFERALFSPTTSSVDPRAVVEALTNDARGVGIDIRLGVAYLRKTGNNVRTTTGSLAPGYVINAAGLYADRIARDYGFSQNYVILPFKGLYLYGDAAESLRCHVYPVPDMTNPFLGVHFTVTVDGHVKIGPTAIPTLWRENYTMLKRFRLSEMVDVVGREASLLLRDHFSFRRLAFSELRKYRRRNLVALAAELLARVAEGSFRAWGPAGIRAQLLDTRSRRLEMDFRWEGDDRSFHVLNAVSPAFTCAFPFATYLVGQMEQLLK